MLLQGKGSLRSLVTAFTARHDQKVSGLVRAVFKWSGTTKSALLRTGVLVASIAVLALSSVLFVVPTQAATSSTLTFQARLLGASGNLVADGTYNIQFNLYDVSSGGSTLWTESRLNNASQGVTLKSGYFSVDLGSITSFPSTINWDQELWLGMTVRGTGSCVFGSCSPTDAEMTPRFKLTAVPYATSAGQLQKTNGANSLKVTTATPTANITYTFQDAAAGTYNICTSANNCTGLGAYIQNGTTAQNNANFNIQSTGTTNVTAKIRANTSQTADLLQIRNSTDTTSFLSVAASGDITFDTTTFVLDATNNYIGINVTPVSALTLNGSQSITKNNSIMFNGYYSGGDKYLETDSAFQLWHDNSTDNLLLQAAASGTINSAITYATALSISTSGAVTVPQTATFNGTLAVNSSSATLGNATTDRLTVTSQLSGGSPLVFQGATDNAFTTTFSFTDPTANNTITFPDSTGTVCTSANNCTGLTGYIQNSTSGQNNANINIQSTGTTNVTLKVRANTSQTANLLQLRDATDSSSYLTVGSDGAFNSIYGGVSNGFNVYSTGAATYTAAFIAQNSSGTTNNGVLISKNSGAGGAVTNLLQLQQTTGTVTNGLLFDGTMTNLINTTSGSFSVTSAGALSVGSTITVSSLGTANTSAVLCRNASNQLAACSTPPLTNSLTDNITDAFDLQEGTNNYININTTNGAENISFGNATTNPSFSFLGGGTLSLNASLSVVGEDITSTGDLTVSTSGTLYLVSPTNVNGRLTQYLQTAQNADWGIEASVDVFDPTSTPIEYFGTNSSVTLTSNANAQDFSATEATGSYGFAANLGTSLGVGNLRGVSGQVGINGTGSTITVASALYALAPVVTTGSITNNYGLYVQNQTQGTNDYGIYVAGADTYALFVDAGTTRLDGDLEVDTDTLYVDATNNRVGIGRTPSEDLTIGGDPGVNIGFGLWSQNASSFSTRTLITQNATAGSLTIAVDPGQNGSARAFTVGVGASASVFNIGANGATTFQNSTNSTSAFRVLNSAGTATVLGVDTSNVRVGVGISTPSAALHVSAAQSSSSWSTSGMGLRVSGVTYTDTVSSGTVANAVGNSFGQPTFAANSATTFTDAATLYIAGAPVAGTNVTLTNRYSLQVGAGNTLLGGALTVAGLTTLNGDLTVEAGDTFTFNGDAFTDLTGSGLVLSSGVLTIDDTSATGFFRNGGNTVGATAILGTNNAYGLNIKTNNTTRLSFTSGGAGLLTGGTGSVDALTVNNSTSTGNIFVAQDNGSPVFTIADGGNVGIGISPLSNAKLRVFNSYTSATAAESYGILLDTQYAVADTNLKQGLRVSTTSSHTSGTLSTLNGGLFLNNTSGSGGTTTASTALWGRVDVQTGATLTNAYVLSVENSSGSSTPVNQYGIYVNNLTSGSVADYGVYIQGADTYALFVDAGVSRFDGRVEFGQASTATGIARFLNSSNANTVDIQAGATGTSYTLTLPTTVGAANECLRNSGTAGILTFGSCGGASSDPMQTIYNNDSDGSDTIISLTTADDSLIFRNPSSSGTDSGYVLNIDQLNTGAVDALRINNAGTGALVLADNTSATGNGISVDIASNNTTEYALRVTTNNGARTALTVRGDGNAKFGLNSVGSGGNIIADSGATATTGTTEAVARTNVTTVTLTAAGAFANDDVIFINNAGQDYYTRITAGGGTTTLTVSPAVSYDVSAAVTKYNIQNIGATQSNYTTQSNRFFQGYFLGGVVTGAGSTTLSDGNLESTNNLILQRSVTGNVGIGDASPARKLTVRANSGSAAPFTLVTNDYVSGTTGSQFVLEFGASSGNTYTSIGALSAGGSAWNNIQLAPAGNVSINSTTFNNPLTVNGRGVFGGTATGNDTVEVQGAGAGYSLFDRTNGVNDRWSLYASGGIVRLWENGTGDRFSLNQSGNGVFSGTLTVANGSATAPSYNFVGATTYGLSYVSNLGGMPWSSGPNLTGAGFSYYDTVAGSYRWGFRNNGVSTRYLWNNDFTMLGTAPNDAIATHTLYVSGTQFVSSTLQVATGLALGNGSSINGTHLGRNTIQIETDTNYGGVNDAHSGAMLYSANMNGWTTAEFIVAISDNWGSYNTGTPALRVTQSLTTVRSLRILNGVTSATIATNLQTNGIDTYVSVNQPMVVGGGVQTPLHFYENGAGLSATGACRSGGGNSGYNNTFIYALGHCTSLGRYKDNQQPLSIGLSELRQLQSVEFDWNINNNGHDLGFIAEQVEAVSPLLAEYTNGQLSGVKYNQMSSLLVKSVQQLDVQVQSIDTRLAVLESGQFAGNLTVQGDTTVQKLTVNGKIISSGTAPTLALGQALTGIVGAAITGDGTDTAGTVTVSSGTQASTVGEIAEVTFTSAYGTAPKVVLSGNTALSAKLGAYIVRTTTGFKIVTDDPLQTGQTYSFDYIIIEARN